MYEGKEPCAGCGRSGVEQPRKKKSCLCPDCLRESVEERVEAYLRSTLNDGDTAFPRFRLHINKDFGNGIVPRIAIAMYVSQKFLDSDRPTIVWAYEFINEKLTEEKLYSYVGMYSLRRPVIKPYIVSTFAFDQKIISMAELGSVGLVLVNPSEAMTSDSYIAT